MNGNNHTKCPLGYHHTDTVVISDFHAGSKNFKAGKLAKFLGILLECPPHRLIIAGDAFELWSTNYKNIGPAEHRIMQKIFELSEVGTKIVYIPGNHDRAFRAFRAFTFGQVKIRFEYVIRIGRKRYIVMHGDEFDSFTRNHVIISLILDQVYVLMVKLSAFMKRFFGIRTSVSKLKHTETYSELVEKIRALAIRYARSRDADGIIIGHTHWPELVESPDGVVYANAGDWLDDCTYVIVSEEGLKLETFKNGNGA